MIISGYSQSISYQVAQVYAEIGAQEVAVPVEEPLPNSTSDDAIPEVQPAPDRKVRGENGVLRLLQEGHFKPHAEMRLMEIFHRDLAILQAQNGDGASQPEANPTEAEEI